MFGSLQCSTLSVILVVFYTLHSLINADERLDLVAPKIVGGKATNISSTPYLVYLLRNGQFHCGGALVKSQYVVTAAHCTVGVNRNELIVVGGATLLKQSGVRRKVLQMARPRSYSMTTRNMDIAVLKLQLPMTGPNISPIGLCSTKFKTGGTISLSGWGRTRENAAAASEQVRTVQLKLISRQKCQKRFKGEETLTSTMFCAYTPGKDSCQGDSGGPVVYNGETCGVVSWGYGCARQGYPGVYTSINKALPFLIKALRI